MSYPSPNQPNQPQQPSPSEYTQNQYGQPQSGYPNQPPQGYPPNQYGQPQYSDYALKRNNTPFIIGGIVALIAIIAIVFVLVSQGSSGRANDIVGSWFNPEASFNAVTTFNNDGTYRWEDDNSWHTGIWLRHESYLIMIQKSGSSTVSGINQIIEIVSVSNNQVIIKSPNGGTVTLIRQ
ncbi:MAG: hypothetical protein SFZ02_10110 [bacterium]|nr:hypothetical protein [bacterium]